MSVQLHPVSAERAGERPFYSSHVLEIAHPDRVLYFGLLDYDRYGGLALLDVAPQDKEAKGTIQPSLEDQSARRKTASAACELATR
jgi:hypothetical protein